MNHGTKNIQISAYDLKNNLSVTTISYRFTFNQSPLANFDIKNQDSSTVPSMIWFNGALSSDPDGDKLNYAWDFGDSQSSTDAMPTHLYKIAGSYNVTLKVSDEFGAENIFSKSVVLTNPVLPVDPVTVAPQLVQEVIQKKSEAYGFLYQGPSAIQKNVVIEKMVEQRLTPIHGKVLKSADIPVSGVKISIKDHPEFGFTLSREDGSWDMVINGGGRIFVEFYKSGFAWAQRPAVTDKNTAQNIEDLYLIEVDDKKTVVQLNSPEPQVHVATLVSDNDGIRRAQVVIPENTTAQVIMADGSTKSVNQLTIRATEFTVGADGEKRMPAQLPPRSAYTYAASFTADEAIAMGGESVEFSKPVPIYVDNFLNIPVGIAVPVGYLNPKTGFWEAMDDGVVLKVLSVDINQKAEIDIYNTGSPATAQELAQINVTDSELKVIAQKFTVGQTFWRAMSKHFSIIDLNFIGSGPHQPIDPLAKPEICIPCMLAQGCIINVQRQLLAEKIDLPGLGKFDLNYSTDRTDGRKKPSTVAIYPFTGNETNQYSILNYAVVTAYIEGQTFSKSYLNPDSGQLFEFSWNGRDRFNRKVYSAAAGKIIIDYYYHSRFDLYDFHGGEAGRTYDTNSGVNVSAYFASRRDYKVTYTLDTVASSPYDQFRMTAQKQFNGWALGIHHSYDPQTQTLYKGNGDTIKSDTIGSVVQAFAGSGAVNSSGDNGLSYLAGLNSPNSIAQDAVGNIYVTEAQGFRIRKIGIDKIITTIAGNGSSAYTGDGGLAINAAIGSPRGIAVKEDGTIFFTDALNHVVRKISLDGMISTIAGSGTAGYSGDEGLAINAKLNGPRGIVLALDGSLYISDTNNNMIRRLWTDGRITLHAGVGTAGYSGDNGPAVLAQINAPTYADIDKYGNLFIADTLNHRIRKVDTSGMISTIAGNGLQNNFSTDNTLFATDISIDSPTYVKTDNLGSIYFSEANKNRIRKIDPAGKASVMIGTGTAGFNGNNRIGLRTQISNPQAFIILPNDHFLFVDSANNRLRKFANNLPGQFPLQIPSSDASEIYFFNADGLHEKTVFADTNAMKYQFSYDANKFINSVVDAHGKTLTIGRDSQNRLSSMTGAYGQVYQFVVDSNNNYVTSITDPLSNTYHMNYTVDGLMTSYQKPEGQTSLYEFDLGGNLTKVTEPNGGYKILTKLPDDSVRMTTSENVVSTYKFTNLWPDVDKFIYISSDNKTVSTEMNSKYNSNWSVDSVGTTTFSQNFSHPRFPGFASYAGQTTKTFQNNFGSYYSGQGISITQKPDGFNFIENTQIIDSTGVATTSLFDSEFKTTNLTTITGQKMSSQMDDQTKIINQQFAQFLPVYYNYDAQGRMIQISQGQRITAMTYDQNGFLNKIVDPENRETYFINDVIGRVLKTIYPDTAETLLQYDKNSNITGITPPQRMIHLFVHNAMDLLSSYTAPDSSNGRSLNYDTDNRLRSIASEENKITNYSFGADLGAANNNKVINVNAGAFGIQYEYDQNQKNILAANSTDGIGIFYQRISDDVLLSKDYSGAQAAPAKISYVYSPNGLKLTSEIIHVNNEDFVIPIVLDRDNRLVQADNLYIQRDPQSALPVQKFFNGFQENIVYSSYGEISERSYKYNNILIYSETYTRDKLGRITNKLVNDFINNNLNITNLITAPLQTTKNFSYTYDLKGRVKTISENNQLATTLNYDIQGNRTSATDNNNITRYAATYNTKDRITSYDFNNQHITLNYSEDDTYVEKNNITLNTAEKYSYSTLHQLQSVEQISPTQTKTIKYLTDGENKRSAKLINNVPDSYFAYDKNGRLVLEFDENKAGTARYIYGTQDHSPDVMNSEFTSIFIKDQLGSILYVIDTSGTVKQKLEYNVFGKVETDTNPGYQPFGYAGGIYDHDTGLVRFGARDYDGSTGRWLTRDPILFSGGDTNLYGYVGNDFVNRVDPSGLFVPAIAIGGAIVAEAVVDAVIGAATTIGFICNQKVKQKAEPRNCQAEWNRGYQGCQNSTIGLTECMKSVNVAYANCVREVNGQ